MWTLYLLPTSKEFSDILYVEKPKNINDLYFMLQFPKNEISNDLKLQSPLSKRKKNSTDQVKSNGTRQSNLPSTSSLSSRSTQINLNPNRKVSGKLDPDNKSKSSVVKTRHYEKTQQKNVLPSIRLPTQTSNWEISNDLELQPPPAKKHKNSAYDVLHNDEMRQNFPSRNQFFSFPDLNEEISDNSDIQSKKRRSPVEEVLTPSDVLSRSTQTVIEEESSKLSVNFGDELKSFFENSHFTIIESNYIESQRVITFLEEIGSNKVLTNDPRVDCVIVSYFVYFFI
jgi:hypothetical protein